MAALVCTEPMTSDTVSATPSPGGSVQVTRESFCATTGHPVPPTDTLAPDDENEEPVSVNNAPPAKGEMENRHEISADM